MSTGEDSNKNELNLNTIPNSRDLVKPTMEDSSTKDVIEEKPDVDLRAEEKMELNEDLADSVEETEPKLMSEEEKEAFLKEIFAKVIKLWRL